KPAPTEISENEQQLIYAFETYIEAAGPDDGEVAWLMFLEARIYHRHERFDEAIPRFEAIIEHDLEQEVGEYSVNLLLDSLIRAERFDEMIAWVERLLAAEHAAYLDDHEELADRLRARQQQARRKAAEKQEMRGEYAAC